MHATPRAHLENASRMRGGSKDHVARSPSHEIPRRANPQGRRVWQGLQGPRGGGRRGEPPLNGTEVLLGTVKTAWRGPW